MSAIAKAKILKDLEELPDGAQEKLRQIMKYEGILFQKFGATKFQERLAVLDEELKPDKLADVENNFDEREEKMLARKFLKSLNKLEKENKKKMSESFQMNNSKNKKEMKIWEVDEPETDSDDSGFDSTASRVDFWKHIMRADRAASKHKGSSSRQNIRSLTQDPNNQPP